MAVLAERYPSFQRPVNTGGAGCMPWDDFVLDSTRLAYAQDQYPKIHGGAALPERVAALVTQKAFCSRGSIYGQLKANPPSAGDTAATTEPKPPGPPPPAQIDPRGPPGWQQVGQTPGAEKKISTPVLVAAGVGTVVVVGVLAWVLLD